MAARPTGRLVPWTERDRAEWIAHELDGFILLEPVSEGARREMARYPDLVSEEGWFMAEWWEHTLECAVAREIANGWNVTTSATSEQPFDSEACTRMLAAILTGDTVDGMDLVSVFRGV